MNGFLRYVVWLLIAAVLVTAWGGCMRWRFNECKAVGHSTLYCLIATK